MSDFDKYSSLQPPTDPQERVEWLRAQEDRIALLVRRELVRLIDSSTEAFVNSLTATGDMSYFDQIPMQWNMWVDDVLLEEMQGMFLAGGLTAVTGTDGTLRIVESLADSWVEVVNENAVEYAKVAQNRMKDVGMTAWNDIKNKVSTSIEKGTSVEDLKTLIEKNRSFSEFRADTIARTETLNAYNNGNWEGSQALGEYGPTHKYWINTGDARSRETHNTVGSQPAIPVGQPFLVGGEEMMFPHSPGASAKNVVNCRCLFGELWPGDIDPNTGNPIGETVIAIPETSSVQSTDTSQPTPQRTTSKFGRGPNGQPFSDLLQRPPVQRGRAAERIKALDEAAQIIDGIHGAPLTSRKINIVLGGKADRKGGHFATATRGSKPKRTSSMTFEQWKAKVTEYNAREITSEIRVNDFDIDRQMSDFTHELGHATDWDGGNFVSRRAWTSTEVQALHTKYRADWWDHIDEIQDESIRTYLELAKTARDAESLKKYVKGLNVSERQYFYSIEEVWARSYAQWVSEVSGDVRLRSAMDFYKEAGFQFSDEDFAKIGPIIEKILRLRGLMK